MANNKFTIDDSYVHIKGKKIKLFKSGNRQYVAYVKEDLDENSKGTYYYILNQNVRKASGLVFEKIPEINIEYD